MQPTTHARTTCARCGSELPLGWAPASCPRCLMHFSIEALELSDAIPPATAVALAEYELLGEVARGGMGVVYRARHRRLDRIVAIKVLAAAPFASAEARQRFRTEAAAAARLQHPGIVAIHDVGETDGLPWLAMDFVPGDNLAALVREQPLPGRQAAAFVRDIAEAVQHAHDHGVLHRDLKPSNVLLDPDAGPRVTDFGIARCGPSTELTRTGEVLGSPGYAAPEQAFGGTASARTDVYGLGGLLYHLITARPPFQGPTLDSILLQLREAEPLAPRRLNPAVPRDVETICLRCLRKNPANRYATSREVAEELGRFLRGEAIHARPISAVARTWRWCRRKPAVAALLATLLAVAVAAFMLIDSARRVAKEAREKLGHVNERLAESLDSTELDRAEDLFAKGDVTEALTLLAQVVRRNPGHPVAAPRLASALWHGDVALPLPPWRHAGGKVVFMAMLRDGETLLTCTDKGIRTSRAATGERLLEYQYDDGPLDFALLSTDERTIVAWQRGPKGMVCVFDLPTGRKLLRLRTDAALHRVALSADGSRILCVESDGVAILRETRSGNPVGSPLKHPVGLWSASFSTDGDTIVTAAGTTVHWWNCRTQEKLRESPPFPTVVKLVRHSPDDRWILVACEDGTMRLLSASDGSPVGNRFRHTGDVRDAEFSSDGTRLLTRSEDHTARLWSVPDCEAITPPLRHRDALNFARFSPDATTLVTCSRDNSTRVWDAATGKPRAQVLRHFEQPRAAVFTPDGNRLLASGADGILQYWNLRHLSPPHATAAESQKPEPGGIRRSPRGSFTVSWAASAKAVATLNDARTGKQIGQSLVHADAITNAAFSPDEALVATASDANDARIWETATARPIGVPLRHARTVSAIAFSPDRARIATGSWDNTAQIWDVNTGRALLREMRHADHVTDVCFSPDGRRLATASRDGAVRLWDLATGQPLTEPLRHMAPATQVRFEPDGEHLLVLTADGRTQTWEAPGFKSPPPAWLADFAESVALAGPPPNRFTIFASFAGYEKARAAALAHTGDDSYARLARRLFGEDAGR